MASVMKKNKLLRLVFILMIVTMASGLLLFFTTGAAKAQLTAVEESDTAVSEVRENLLKFDGLYTFFNEEKVIYYNFRFYEDGTAMAVSLSAQPTQTVLNWFDKDQSGDQYQIGTYEIEGDHIKFFCTNANGGTVEYEGTVDAGGMTLDSVSLINGFKSYGRYYAYTPFDQLGE